MLTRSLVTAALVLSISGAAHAASPAPAASWKTGGSCMVMAPKAATGDQFTLAFGVTGAGKDAKKSTTMTWSKPDTTAADSKKLGDVTVGVDGKEWNGNFATVMHDGKTQVVTIKMDSVDKALLASLQKGKELTITFPSASNLAAGTVELAGLPGAMGAASKCMKSVGI
jgi:hypothetical protein